MSIKTAWALLDVVALALSALLVVLGKAPPSMLVSVLTVLVAVRAGKRGAQDDDDDNGGGRGGSGTATPQTPRLGGVRRPIDLDGAASSSVILVGKGVARWARELSRRFSVIDVAAALALALGLAFAILTT